MGKPAVIWWNSPVGWLKIAASEHGLCQIAFVDQPYGDNHGNYITQKTVEQLQEYFDGRRRKFKLPLLFDGTPFQVKVWQALFWIPYGQTITYSELGGWLGDRNKARAVGTACGRNAIPIIIPCHRVVSASGLGGFAADLSIKEKLLLLEKGAYGR